MSTTDRLIALLRERHDAGLKNYGVTVDRTDLTPEQWAQHAIEENLDGAAYLMRLKDEIAWLRERIKRLEEAGQRLNILLCCEAGFADSEEWANSLRDEQIRMIEIASTEWDTVTGRLKP